MYILTQDKKKIVELGKLEISKNCGGKKKYALVVYRRGTSATDVTVAGLYPDEESASAEFMRVVAALRANEPIYEIR